MVSLAELKQRVRERADMVNSQFISDQELKTYINGSYSELYDILVSRYEDYFIKEASLILNGSNSIQLPDDFYKCRGVDLDLGGSFETLKKWSFEDRTSQSGVITRRFTRDRSYRIMGNKLIIMPESETSGSYKLWYIPKFTELFSDNSTADDVLNFDEYIVLDSAIKCLMKEESDTTFLLNQKASLKARILAMASNRDSQPDRILDLRGY